MAKISVRHGVAQAYGLLFGRPFTVIGLTWLPAVFYAVGADFLIQRMNAAMAVAVPASSGLLGQYAFFYFAALVAATAFFGATIAVSLTRQAFGLREEFAAVHLVVGGRELRLFFAFLRYYAIVVTALIVLAIGGGIAISQGTHYAIAHGLPAVWQGYTLETWFNSVAGATAVIVFSVLAVRYGFFLDALASVEDHAGLGRASSLTHGNFWSIATTLFLTGVPACLLLLACEMTFGGLTLASISHTPVDVAAFASILAAGLVVLHTLLAGASAGAYRELADAVAQESAPYEAAHEYAPAAVLAASPTLFPGAPEQAIYPTQHAEAMTLAVPAVADFVGSEVAAEPAPAAVQSPWMAPPPDAHFGSDTHDAPHHELNLHHEAQVEPLAEAVAATEPAQEAASPVVGAAPVDVSHEAVALADAPAETAAAEHVASASIVEPHSETDVAVMQTVGFDGHPVPDHAHNAEFPPPPLDPAGVIAAAQAGFQAPPPG